MERMVKGGKKIILTQGDITELSTDAIVNAANEDLILGSGVAGAIRKKGGPSIQEECNRIGRINVGEAVVTGAGNLKAKYVIHAVGPRYGEGNEDEKLRNATWNSLLRAGEKGCLSITFPAISTGVFGFPKDRCASIMLKTVLEFLETQETTVKEVVFCLYSQEDLEIFKKALEVII
ncbi:MAG: macro domain-containing protein [Syntrophobacterales bacterium]|nr:macro domain-containing protein [Syntrophobacterales bacterium]